MMEGQRSSAADAIASVSEAPPPNLREQTNVHDSRGDRSRSPPLHPPAPDPKDPLAAILESFVAAQQQQSQAMLQFQQQQATMLQGVLSQLTTVISQQHAQTAPATPLAPVLESQHAPERPAPTVPVQLAQVPPELDSIIVKRSRAWKQAVFALARAKAHIKKLQADVTAFDSDDTTYPKSHRAFKSPISFVELDAPLSASTSTAWTFQVEIQPNTTRREAMRVVHRSAAKFFAASLLEAHTDHLASCEADASVTKLHDVVAEVLDEAAQPELAEALGLPRPLTRVVSQPAIQARVDALYEKTYAALTVKLKSDQDAAIKSEQTRDEELKRLSERKSPGDVLQSLVKDSVASELRAAGLNSEQTDDPMQPILNQDNAEAINIALAGNGVAPLEGVGHNHQGRQQQRQRPTTAPHSGNNRGTPSRGQSHHPSAQRGWRSGKQWWGPINEWADDTYNVQWRQSLQKRPLRNQPRRKNAQSSGRSGTARDNGGHRSETRRVPPGW